MQGAMRTHETRGGQEYFAIRKDGTSFPGVVSTSVVVRNGVPVGLRGLVIDVTARKQAELERERLLNEVETWASQLDAVVSAIPVGLVIFDGDGNIIRTNAFGAKIMVAQSPEEDLPLQERIKRLRMETTEGEPISLGDAPPLRALRGEMVQDMVVILHLPGRRIRSVRPSARPQSGLPVAGSWQP